MIDNKPLQMSAAKLSELSIPDIGGGTGITVARLLDHMYREAGCRGYPLGVSDFCALSPEHQQLQLRLIRRADEIMPRSDDPECWPPNIDAVATLHTRQVLEILRDFEQLEQTRNCNTA